MAKSKKQEHDPDFEIAFYENVLKRAPDFIEALMALGDLYTRQGFYEKGLRVDEKLASLRPDDPYVRYNLSCSYSLMNDVAAAKSAMRTAFACGYDDLDYLLSDPDLSNLLADPDFQKDLDYFRTKIKRPVEKTRRRS